MGDLGRIKKKLETERDCIRRKRRRGTLLDRRVERRKEGATTIIEKKGDGEPFAPETNFKRKEH